MSMGLEAVSTVAGEDVSVTELNAWNRPVVSELDIGMTLGGSGSNTDGLNGSVDG